MLRKMKSANLGFIILFLSASNSWSGEADVTAVEAHPLSPDRWRLDVTVQHDDEGWHHFANRWEVMDETGTIIGTRTLAHPHVHEQPFTRSMSLDVPENVSVIRVRANDLVHGTGGKQITVKLK